ncbi:MAG: F0F1 ATP synthase subunit delta [Neisseriaceae bacterium]
MANDNIAYPYASALFEIAKSDGKIEEWLSILNNLCKISQTPDFIDIMGNPKITSEKVTEILMSILGTSDKNIKNFLDLLHFNNRFSVLPEIFTLFEKMFEDDAKIATAVIESAFPIKDQDIEQIENILSNRFNKKVNADVKINSELIGGIKIIVDDIVIDASIQGSLSKMAMQLKR